MNKKILIGIVTLVIILIFIAGILSWMGVVRFTGKIIAMQSEDEESCPYLGLKRYSNAGYNLCEYNNSNLTWSGLVNAPVAHENFNFNESEFGFTAFFMADDNAKAFVLPGGVHETEFTNLTIDNFYQKINLVEDYIDWIRLRFTTWELISWPQGDPLNNLQFDYENIKKYQDVLELLENKGIMIYGYTYFDQRFNDSYSLEENKKIMRQHANMLAKHFPQVDVWQILNEANWENYRTGVFFHGGDGKLKELNLSYINEVRELINVSKEEIYRINPNVSITTNSGGWPIYNPSNSHKEELGYLFDYFDNIAELLDFISLDIYVYQDNDFYHTFTIENNYISQIKERYGNNLFVAETGIDEDSGWFLPEGIDGFDDDWFYSTNVSEKQRDLLYKIINLTNYAGINKTLLFNLQDYDYVSKFGILDSNLDKKISFDPVLTLFNELSSCIISLTNTSWSSWVDIQCLPSDKINQIRNLTQYDSNNCGEVSNQTFTEYRQTESCDFCTPSLSNTSKSTWSDDTYCRANDTILQSRFWTQYDSNSCGEYTPESFYEYQEISCDYCTPSLYNQSTAWSDIQCLPGNQMNQTRNLTQTDSSGCYALTSLPSDYVAPTIFTEYRLTEGCDFCTPSLYNTSWSSWINQGVCKIDDLQFQNKSKIQYDLQGCGEIANQTFWSYQNVSCNYCSYLESYTDWNSWANITACANNNLTQNRSRVKYDSNYNFCYAITGIASDYLANVTEAEARNITCGVECLTNLTNTSWSGWLDIGSCVSKLKQQRQYKKEYDKSNCGVFDNVYYYNYQNVSCATSSNDGGGSSSSNKGKTHTPTSTDLSAGYARSMGKKDKITFTAGGGSHNVETSVITKNKKVRVTVSSNPKTKDMEVGGNWVVDADDDGDNDLEVYVNKIGSSSADITIWSIEEVSGSSGEDVVEEEVVEQVLGEDEVEDKGGAVWIFALIFSACLFLGLVFVMVVLLRKKVLDGEIAEEQPVEGEVDEIQNSIIG